MNYSPREDFAQLYDIADHLKRVLGISDEEPRTHSRESFDGLLERFDTIALNVEYLGYHAERSEAERNLAERAMIEMQKELCWLKRARTVNNTKMRQTAECWRHYKESKSSKHRHYNNRA
jgi:hypothetical protein